MTTSSSGDTAGPDYSTHSRPAWVYHGTGMPRPGGAALLPSPPPWRGFKGGPALEPPPDDAGEVYRRLGRPARAAQPGDRELAVINAALVLRRPLLVTGLPGTGKSTLPYQIAHELGLGRVLYWPITSRTSLQQGLYQYDAIGRVQATATWRAGISHPAFASDSPQAAPAGEAGPPSVGTFISLGPLGTALLPFDQPRVLLIDELDKSDIDLPNDLLSVFEEGSYEIPELVRAETETVEVRTHDPGRTAPVRKGRVQCRQFPIVVITSNGEREFPPAFLRRCLRLDLPQPSADQLGAMVAAHFSEQTASETPELVRRFLQRSAESGGLAIDQLLNAVHLVTNGTASMDSDQWQPLVDALWRSLHEY